MKTRIKAAVWQEYAVVLLFFMAGTNLLWYFKAAGFYTIFSDLEVRPFDPVEAHVQTSLGSLLLGLQFIWFDSYLHRRLSGHLTRWQHRTIWSLGTLFLIFSTVWIVQVFYLWTLQGHPFERAWSEAVLFLKSGMFASFLLLCFFLSIAVSFVRQLRINFGETVFLNYLYGKYARPLVEQRSFMFLDLNDSTRIAEALGHVKYSRFLNQCFDDILESLTSFDFEIYQFVGDEVVLTWKTEQETSGTAIAMYRAVRKRLLKKRESFIALFGVAPTFKAGVSSGEVTATLVGKTSRHMAYHGDVLNTAARLLGQCTKLNQAILFTDFYLKSIKEPLPFEPQLVSELKLRGKNNTTRIYGVTLSAPEEGEQKLS